MSLAKEAYAGLYPGKIPEHEFRIRYSGRFNDFNANVYYTRKSMEFRLSRKWKPVSSEIKIGLMQSLMLKVLKDSRSTVNIDLYNIFLKKVHIASTRTEAEPELARSFIRVNDAYFDGMIEMPNLVFGRSSKTKLGSYEYGSDTITISTVLRGSPELLDYVMYHEMLHKKFKFTTKKGRSYHHTREFRQAERRFKDHELMEKRLGSFLRSRKRFLGFF